MSADFDPFEGVEAREKVVEGPPSWFEEAAASYGPIATDPVDTPIVLSPFLIRPEAEIPRRRWLYGKHLIRDFVSLDVAAGGVGKSSLKIGEAIAMATGRDVYGKEMPEGRLRIWLYNLEDPKDEIERRIHATCKRFHIPLEELADWLYVDSGRDNPLIIATEGPGGAMILRPRVDRIEQLVREGMIDVLSVDPFVSSHSLNENDNRAMDLAAKEWSALAGRLHIAVNLVHHSKKMGGAEATAESTRGASALVAAARSVAVYNRMTADEAGLAGIPPEQANFHFRVTNDKANLAPPESADWYRMNNVDLANGDSVGVACPWRWPDVFDGISKENLRAVQRAISEGKYRKDPRSSDWVGNIIATMLSMDPEEHKKRLQQIIKQWVKTDMLREVEDLDEKRMKRTFLEVGTWVTD